MDWARRKKKKEKEDQVIHLENKGKPKQGHSLTTNILEGEIA